MTLLRRFGYRIEEVDSTTSDLIQFLVDLDTPTPLMLLALCRSIVAIGTDSDLDLACSLLDELREYPTDGILALDEFDGEDE